MTFDKFDNNKSTKLELAKDEHFYKMFRKHFVSELYRVILSYYPSTQPSAALNRALNLYANEMLSSVETVILKEKNYTESQFQEEVEVMSRIATSDAFNHMDLSFLNTLHVKAKEICVNHFSEIFDFSGNGFRLLEKYAMMYNREFANFFDNMPGGFKKS